MTLDHARSIALRQGMRGFCVRLCLHLKTPRCSSTRLYRCICHQERSQLMTFSTLS